MDFDLNQDEVALIKKSIVELGRWKHLRIVLYVAACLLFVYGIVSIFVDILPLGDHFVLLVNLSILLFWRTNCNWNGSRKDLLISRLSQFIVEEDTPGNTS